MKETRRTREGRNRIVTRIVAAAAIVLILGLPLVFLQHQSAKTGKTWMQVLGRFFSKANESETFVNAPKGKKLDFLNPQLIGDPFTKPPQISNIQAVDLDKDGLLDVVGCDVLNTKIFWIRQFPAGVYAEHLLADSVRAPSHVQAIDFDNDGDLDLIVSSLGMLFPSNDRIGSIVILENDRQMKFTRHVIIDKIARASDVRAGDLNGDGRLDLVTVEFGYDDGETRWLENLGNWKFQSHILQSLSGGINCELVDIDKDGDLDIITLISQEWEEIYLFVNSGKGAFESKLIYGSTNEDFGSSSISLVDLNQDGQIDILYTNGDAFDYIPPRPRPWHGVNWLENKGNYSYEFHRIANFGGAYGARALDVNHDGHLDIVAVSAFNLWENPTAQSMIWLENDGKTGFIQRDIASSPTHILSLSLGDFNNDGELDVVTGGMHAYPPYDRMARVTLWTNNWRKSVK